MEMPDECFVCWYGIRDIESPFLPPNRAVCRSIIRPFSAPRLRTTRPEYKQSTKRATRYVTRIILRANSRPRYRARFHHRPTRQVTCPETRHRTPLGSSVYTTRQRHELHARHCALATLTPLLTLPTTWHSSILGLQDSIAYTIHHRRHPLSFASTPRHRHSHQCPAQNISLGALTQC